MRGPHGGGSPLRRRRLFFLEKSPTLAFLLGWMCALACPAPARGSAGEAPRWIVSADIGYAPTRYLGDDSGSPLPLISVGRVLDQRWEVRAQAGRLGYRYEYLSGPLRLRADATFVAVGAGIRVHVPKAFATKPSVFIDIVPIVLRAHWKSRYDSLTRALPGLWEGVGIRFPTGRASGLEVVAGYVFSRNAKEVYREGGAAYYEGLSQPAIACGFTLGLGG